MPASILLALFSLLLLTACGQQDTQAPASDGAADAPSLQKVLDARKAEWAEGATDEVKSLYDDGIAKVAATGVLDTMKNVGDAAPAFTLPDEGGEDVALATLLADGPVVIVFYRGAWCPYCNLTLAAWQEQLDTIQGLGARFVAISPQLPDYSLKSVQDNGLAFPVLSDVGNKVADAFGITTQVTPEIVTFWEGKIDLEKHNGDASAKLPLAATYLIDADGTILFAHAHEDYRTRAEPAEVIAKLEEIAGK
ncbi:MAG: peroxiredoxin-like family protein [Planctomycetota bacterium]